MNKKNTESFISVLEIQIFLIGHLGRLYRHKMKLKQNRVQMKSILKINSYNSVTNPKGKKQ